MWRPQAIASTPTPLAAVAFRPDGQVLASAGKDGRIRLHRVPGLEEIDGVSGFGKAVAQLAFHPEGRWLASAAPAEGVRLWDLETLQCRLRMAELGRATFSPDGHLLAGIGRGSRANQVALWDVEPAAPTRTIELADRRLSALAFARGGSLLLVGGAGPIYRLALPDGTPEGVQRGQLIGVHDLAVSPKGTVTASAGADGTLWFWTAVGGDEVHHASIEAPAPPSGYRLAFDGTGQRIALLCRSELLLLGVPDAQVRKRVEFESEGPAALASSPDGRWLANAGQDGCVRLFELAP